MPNMQQGRKKVPKGWMTALEVADVLGVTRQRVEQLRRAGRLRHKVIPMWANSPDGQQVYIYPDTAVARFKASREATR